MQLAFFDFLNEKYQYLILLLLILMLLALAALFIYYHFYHKVETFDDSLDNAKADKIAICIDLLEKTVERYYMYDKKQRKDIISFDSFILKFDKKNALRLNEWIAHISRMTNFNKTRRVELVMYNDEQKRRVYIVELENYIAELRRFYMTFKDVTSSVSVFRKVARMNILIDNDEFFAKANEKISAADQDAKNYVVAFRYREYAFATKELQDDMLHLIEEKIYQKLDKSKFDRDLLCLTSKGTFLLVSTNVTNQRKFRQHLRSLIFSNSGTYDFIKHKFNYQITLFAGCSEILPNEKLTFDKTLEAETAANDLIYRGGIGKLTERFQFFDEKLQNYHTLLNNKLIAVEKVINEDNFFIEYVPIIHTKDKKVKGYYISITIPQTLDMDLAEFIDHAKEKFYLVAYFKKIFENVVKKNDKKAFYLSFDFAHLNQVMEAYHSRPEFKRINFYMCLEFSSTTLQVYDPISIEKSMSQLIDEDNIKFGISYSSLNPLYLNSKIYAKADAILLRGTLINHVLDNYNNETLLDVYINVANVYDHDIIGLDVDSIALYEMLTHNKVNKLGGKFISNNIKEDQIEDESLLKTLTEIENRPY